jgi:hypothetical protein
MIVRPFSGAFSAAVTTTWRTIIGHIWWAFWVFVVVTRMVTDVAVWVVAWALIRWQPDCSAWKMMYRPSLLTCTPCGGLTMPAELISPGGTGVREPAGGDTTVGGPATVGGAPVVGVTGIDVAGGGDVALGGAGALPTVLITPDALPGAVADVPD